MIVNGKMWLLCIIFINILSGCIAGEKNNIDKYMQLYWKYDELFAIKEEVVNNIEKYNKVPEKFLISDIEEKYQDIIMIKIEELKKFISENIENFKILYNNSVNENGYCITSPSALLNPKYKIEYETYKKLEPQVKINLLDKYINCVRIIYGIRMTTVFEVAKKINGEFATTPYWPDSELTLWSDYYMYAEYAPKQTYKIVENYAIKYPYWFYESNLKLIVVVQVRDEEGNYYGELRVDFYKFEDYDMLFDKLGNPK